MNLTITIQLELDKNVSAFMPLYFKCGNCRVEYYTVGRKKKRHQFKNRRFLKYFFTGIIYTV
jgi:hypothetical protein